MSYKRRGRKRRPDPREVKKKHRLNGEIRAEEVRLLDPEGEMIGVVGLSVALTKAQEAGVDLVEVSPKAKPPVCQIIDYGKMLYTMKKKEKKQEQANKTLEMKGIRLTFRMDTGDAERQKKKAMEFMEAGHSVKLQLVMRGREKAHRDLAFEKIKAFIDGLTDFGTLDQPPKGAGHQIVAVLKPSKAK